MTRGLSVAMRRGSGRITAVRARRVSAIVVALFVGSLAACAGSKPAPQQSGPPTFEGKQPSGFVEMHEVQVAYIGSAGGGDGTLTYQGQSHPFKIGGLGVAGTASVGDLWLKNEHDVVLHLKAKREGLMLSVGADVVDIHLSQ